jgi:hypothetical protein
MSEKLSEVFKKPSTLDEQVDSICQAGAIVAVSRIKAVLANNDGYGPDQVRLILETAQTHEVRAKTQRPAVRQMLRNALKKLEPKPTGTRLNKTTGLVELTYDGPKLPIEILADKTAAERKSSSNPQSCEIVTDAECTRADLRASAERINQTIELIKGHEEAFDGATLEHRLCIGLEIARAQEAFGMTRAEAGTLGGRPEETLPTVGKVSAKPAESAANPLGFSNWIRKETPDLPRSTAQRYASAFRSLGIDSAEATPQRIQAKLKDLNHHADKNSLPRPTLAALVKQAPKLPKPENLTIIVPKSSKQLKLEDARETYHLWMETWDKALKHGHLENLDKKGLLQLQEFTATVRDRIKARLK